jgi:hypothetical protein
MKPNSSVPDSNRSLAALRWNVVLEQLIGLLVLGAVSVLGMLPPTSMAAMG